MKISFVIPAYNEENNIARCVESIKKNWAPEFLEIIVADNTSTDRTSEIAKNIPGVKVVEEPKKGTNNARQRGFIETKGDFVAYLDADSELHPGWLPIVKSEFAKNPNLVSLSGPFRYNDMPPSKKFLAETLWKIFVPPFYWYLGFAILGANFVAKREALQKIGGFDTSIVFHGDDADTARRLSAIGKVKFKMDFFIIGSGRRLLKHGVIKSFWTYGVNYLWTSIKHKPYTPGYGDAQ